MYVHDASVVVQQSWFMHCAASSNGECVNVLIDGRLRSEGAL